MRKNLLYITVAVLLALGCETSSLGPGDPGIPDTIAVRVRPVATNASVFEFTGGRVDTVGDWYNIANKVSSESDSRDPSQPHSWRYQFLGLDRWPNPIPGDSIAVRILNLGVFCDSALLRRGYAHITILPSDTTILDSDTATPPAYTQYMKPIQTHFYTFNGRYFESDSGAMDVWMVGPDSVEIDYALRFKSMYDTLPVAYIRSSGTYLARSVHVTY